LAAALTNSPALSQRQREKVELRATVCPFESGQL
jgi:hypothetical protein